MGMTVCEKILYQKAVGLPLDHPAHVIPGEVICIAPDWILASEAAWSGMERPYNKYGRPAPRRKDRFWLAPDHLVDPRINHLPKQQAMIASTDRIARELEMGDNYAPAGTTIMHTEFARARCQPGMFVIGADSHSGSAGCMGALAIGMGMMDTLVQLIVGETYIKVPATLRINFVGRVPFGIGGKDIILGILGELKRNTVALGRVVEFTGPGMQYLSIDTRFAICNMTTEFGGIGSCAVPDAVTMAYLAARKDPRHKSDGVYFAPDSDAKYAESYDIDLSKIDNYIALYPSPDNVVTVKEATPQLAHLDGCFIGACTTTEEDLIMGALVLEECLRDGKQPIARGNRRVTPGSLPIIAKLKRYGLIEAYERAGFDIGAPGCSYCVGLGADIADKGDIWLSSQNRNFRDRMGPGSFANIASAATVAVSSFTMQLCDPQPYLDRIDAARYNEMRDWTDATLHTPIYVQPTPVLQTTEAILPEAILTLPTLIKGRVQRFGDNIDTDTIIPSYLCFSPELYKKGAFATYKPEFYDKAQVGANIVVAEHGFGSGSSREPAPLCLLGAGVQAVIAKSFAFIYGRNQANNGLLGITFDSDDEFYKLAQEDVEMEVDMTRRLLRVGDKSFPFRLDPIEEQLLGAGGLFNVYEKFGQGLFKYLQQAALRSPSSGPSPSLIQQSSIDLRW